MSGRRRIVLKLRRITACATIEIYVAFPEFFSGQRDKRLPWLAYACLGFCGILFSQTICIIELLNCCRLLMQGLMSYHCVFCSRVLVFVCMKMNKSLKNAFSYKNEIKMNYVVWFTAYEL